MTKTVQQTLMILNVTTTEREHLIEAITSANLPDKVILWELLTKLKSNKSDEGCFVLTDKQIQQLEKIKENNISYIFTPSGIGNIVKVKIGDKIIDITDYDTW